MRFLSPYTSSMRDVVGQNLEARTHSVGKAPSSREYGRSQVGLVTTSAVCGAFLRTLFSRSTLPSSISRISPRMAMSASQNLSSSALDSDSVGSIINVPATGQDIVGEWKP